MSTFAPIQTAAAPSRMIPTIQMKTPSATGPTRPSASPPGFGLLRHGADVLGDLLLLVRGQRLVAEHGHRLGSGDHRLVDVLVGRLGDHRGELAARERAAATGEVVAGGAVRPEQHAALGQVGVGVVELLGGRDRGSGRQRGDVGRQRRDLLVAVGDRPAHACVVGPASGIRPVPTWKSTAAAPTPIRVGALEPPWAFSPWQEEQPVR